MQTSSKSQAYLGKISSKEKPYLKQISGVSQLYLRDISGISQALHHFVLLNTYLLLIQFGEESIYVDPRSDCACPG